MDYFQKSGRSSVLKCAVTGCIYCLLGNIMCAIMTISTAPFIGSTVMKVIVFVLTLAIFYSLVFTAGYKDGDREQKYVRLHKAEPPKTSKWIVTGAIMTAVMLIPSLILLLDKVCGWYFDMTMVHRILDGMIYPLSLILVPENSIESMAVFVPVIYMLCYMPIPAATHAGFYFGYTQKFDKDKIIYKD